MTCPTALETMKARVDAALRAAGFADRRRVRVLIAPARPADGLCSEVKAHVAVVVSETLAAEFSARGWERNDVGTALFRAGVTAHACLGNLFRVHPEENVGLKLVLRDVAKYDLNLEVGSMTAVYGVVRYAGGYTRGYVEKDGEVVAWLDRETSRAPWTSNYPTLNGLETVGRALSPLYETPCAPAGAQEKR